MKARIVLTLLGLLTFGELGFGMADEHVGPNRSAVAEPEWPKNIVEVVRHPSRVYSRWVNGGDGFYFHATPAEINQLVALFANARMRDHEIRIKAGWNTVNAFDGTTHGYNVSLDIIGGIALSVTRDKDMEGTLEPVLTIYAGEDRSLLQQLKLPDQAIVKCDFADANLKGKRTTPKRQTWYGEVQFDDGQPASDNEHGVSTCITFWEEASPDSILLDRVSHRGFFHAVFSEDELAALKQGRSWLTMTVGNRQSAAKKDDPRFPADKLVRSGRATPQRVASPAYYYGRILFKDGSPAVLDSKLGRDVTQISVAFPYGGQVLLDREGYFKVFFAPEQWAQIKAREPMKNIYLPVNDKFGSAAMETFPAALLSLDRAKAGVVQIAKPVF